MERLNAAVADLKRDLEDLGARWALIGGLAVSARAEPRTTRDIDVSVAVDSDREAQDLVNDLRSRGYRLRDPGLIEQETTGRIATVRLDASASQGELDVVVDLMFVSSGIEPEIVEQADVIEFLPDVDLPVAQTGHLIALKVLAARPQDLADLDLLLRFTAAEDLDLARKAVRLIIERGTNRGKDLVADLESAIG